MNGTNPWAPWGLIYTLRDGLPSMTETALWQLTATHPEAVERAGDELYIHLDQPYQVLSQDDRAFRLLLPVPGRKRPPPPPPPAPAAKPE